VCSSVHHSPLEAIRPHPWLLMSAALVPIATAGLIRVTAAAWDRGRRSNGSTLRNTRLNAPRTAPLGGARRQSEPDVVTDDHCGGRPAAASLPAWRTENAMKICENPRNNAKNPVQNKIRYAR
jgi:hypothetical protein